MNGSVVLAHQWLVADRGAEAVLRELMRLFPHAPIACLIKSEDFNPSWLAGRTIIKSPLAKLPGARRYYREMLALHPWAIANLRVPDDTEFVLSTDAAMIKGLSLPPGVKQACYCHSPPRYLWDQMQNYCLRDGAIASARDVAFKLSAKLCRTFDKTSSSNVDQFMANSQFVANRIRSIYERKSEVIFPPVEVDDFSPTAEHVDYYLIVSQLVPYKRIDLAVEACSRLSKQLVVVGDGPERRRLESACRPDGQISRADFALRRDQRAGGMSSFPVSAGGRLWHHRGRGSGCRQTRDRLSCRRRARVGRRWNHGAFLRRTERRIAHGRNRALRGHKPTLDERLPRECREVQTAAIS